MPIRSAAVKTAPLERLWHRDAADACVGNRAAHKRDVLHAGEANIGDEQAAAAQETIVFLADQARADALPCRHKRLQADRANGTRSAASGRPGTLRSGDARRRHHHTMMPILG